MRQSIFDQVGQVIVAGDADIGYLILWNQSATLNLYLVTSRGLDSLDCKSLGDTRHDGTVSAKDAQACAEQWLESILTEGEELSD